MEDWLQENFNEGEIQNHIDETEISDYDLYFLKKLGIIDLNQNFTLMKGIFIDFNYNATSDADNDICKNMSNSTLI